MSTGNKKHGITISIGKAPAIKIDGQPVEPRFARGVDLVFVIDTTGSMSNKIDGLLTTCARFVDRFAALSLDYRVAIVAFGDLTVPGDKIETTAFTSKVEVIKRSLQIIPRYYGGSNEGESSLEALGKALSLPFRSNAVKVILLITDEPALQHNLYVSDMIGKLSNQEVLTFVVSPPLAYFKDMANKTGGRWYQIAADTDFTDLVDMFDRIARRISQVVSDVYKIGDGNVARYLQLKPPERG